jgi:elongation factor 1-gamma
MSMKLYGYPYSQNLLMCQLMAKWAKVEVEVHTVENTFTPHKEVADSQTNTYPYLVTPEGTLSQSLVICQYFATIGKMAGSTDLERHQMAAWQQFAYTEIGCAKAYVINPVFGITENCDKQNKENQDKLKAHLKFVNNHLNGKKHLVGDKCSFADLALFVQLRHLWQLTYVDQVRTKLFPNVNTWFNHYAECPDVISIFGSTVCCKAVVKAKIVKKEAPVVEKKVEVKVVKEVVEKKPLYPESNFNFDQYKKDYSNLPNKKEVLDNMFANDYDSKAYSVWRFKFIKADETDCTVLFKTENLRDITMQKIDQNRKDGFAVVGIYGQEGGYEVDGVWMFRGLEVPEWIQDGYEYYEKTQLCPSKPEDRKVIDDFWLNKKTGEMCQGLKIASTVDFK